MKVVKVAFEALLIGIAITVVSLSTGFASEGDYRVLFSVNMLLYLWAGSRIKQNSFYLNAFSLLLLVFPYCIYYYTQLSVSTLILVFPLSNLMASSIGHLILSRVKRVILIRIIAASVIPIVAVSLTTMPLLSTAISSKKINITAPAINVYDLNNQTISLEDLRGKKVIIDFWATWCAPCIAEFKELEEFETELSKDEDVVLLIINEDEGGDLEKVRSFLEKRYFNLPFYIDQDYKAYRAFNSDAYPQLYVIDANGQIRYKKSGYEPSENLSKKLIEIIESI